MLLTLSIILLMIGLKYIVTVEEDKPVSATVPDESPKFNNPLTGEYYAKDVTNSRPIAIAINNSKGARPQWGLCTPDIIIEGLVEGGITRMLWLYSDIDSIPKVGSVRSARHDFIEIAEGFDALFVHWGGSGYAYTAIANRSVNSIDGMAYEKKYFFRDKSIHSSNEHSGYTTGEMISKAIAAKSFRVDINSEYKNPLKFHSPDDKHTYMDGKSNSIKFDFSKYCGYTFNWDSENQLYYCNTNGGKMVSAQGDQLAVSNVIVLYMPSYSVLNESGVIDMNLSSGEGVISSNGSYEKIIWEKGNTPSNMLKLCRSDGSDLLLNTGKSYIAFIPAELGPAKIS
jgi:hypothetical protein